MALSILKLATQFKYNFPGSLSRLAAVEMSNVLLFLSSGKPNLCSLNVRVCSLNGTLEGSALIRGFCKQLLYVAGQCQPY